MLNKRGALSLIQIFILLVSVISFSILSSEIISAENKPTTPGTEGQLSSQKEWIFSAGSWIKNENTKGVNANALSSAPNLVAAAASSSIKFGTTPKIIEYSLVEGKTFSLGDQPITKAYKVDGVWNLKDGSDFYPVKKPESIAELNKGLTDGTLKTVQATSETTGSSTLSGYLGIPTGTYTDAIVSGAQWAAVVGLGAYVLGSFIGLEEGQTNALSLSASMGALTGKS